MSLQERLTDDMKAAMKARDTHRLSAVRLLICELRSEEIAKRAPLTEDEELQVLSREIKRRRESIEQFEKGGRADLVEKESAQLHVLSQYLPEQLDEAEIVGIAQEVISEMHATSRADKGKVMSAVIQRVRGRADGRMVNQIVDRLLENVSV